MSDDSHTEGKLSGCHEAPVVRGGSGTYYICTRCGNVCELAKLPEKQSPKDNQIDIDKLLTDLHVTGRYDDSMFTPRDIRDIVEETKVALATAIREAMPGQLTEFHGQGTMQLEAKVHQAAIDRFLAKLKDIGLEV